MTDLIVADSSAPCQRNLPILPESTVDLERVAGIFVDLDAIVRKGKIVGNDVFLKFAVRRFSKQDRIDRQERRLGIPADLQNLGGEPR